MSAPIEQTHNVLCIRKCIENNFITKTELNNHNVLYHKTLATIMLHISFFFNFNYYNHFYKTNSNKFLIQFFKRAPSSGVTISTIFLTLSRKNVKHTTMHSFILSHYGLKEIVETASKCQI